MKKVFIIAQHEFLVTVTRKGYILMVIGMPLFFGGIVGVALLSGRSTVRTSLAGDAVAIVDQAKIVDRSLIEPLAKRSQGDGSLLPTSLGATAGKIVPYDDLNQAVDDLKENRVSAVYVIGTDYHATGKVALYTREGSLFATLRTPWRAQIIDLLRASLVKDRVSDETRARLLQPTTLERLMLTREGEIKPVRSEIEQLAGFFAPFGLFVMMTMAIFFSSGYLLQGAAEEKQNRVFEILLSSVRPSHLLAGKILGLGAAGLLQVTIYFILFFVPAITFIATFEVNIGKLLLGLVYFILGYLLFASLMAGTGILGDTAQESGQLAAVWTMTSMVPLFLMMSLGDSPNSVLARVLSFFPLTAPVTMLLRISLAKVPTADVLISIAMLLLGVVVVVKGVAKIFRAASLMYGKRPGFTEIIHWLREA